MIRTVASIAAIGLIAWIAIKIIFGVAGGLLGLLISLALFILKVALVVGLVYWLLTVFSPETARKVRDALRGESL
jgi:Na+/H+-dicarboxylate symporter